jgi:cell division protein FtsB
MDWLRLRKRAAEATFVVEYPTDARRTADDPRVAELDPELERRRKLRRGARTFILYTVFVAGAVAALFGEGGLTDLLRLQRELKSARVELSEQQRKVEGLRREILLLESDPAARERIAREELGLTRPGEYLFLLPEEQDTSSGGSEAGAATEEAGEP